jgi:hypothetical protein
MKKKLFLLPLLLIFFINSYGQKKIAGKSISVYQSVRAYLKSSTINEMDTIFSFNTPGNIPSGICFDGINFWHCDTSQFIYKISVSGEVLDSIFNPDIDNYFRGGAMTFDGDNIWLVGEQSAKLFKIDLNGNVLKEFYLPSKNYSDPNGWGIAWDGNYLWHSQYSPIMIYKLDPNNGAAVDSIVPADTIMGIEWINNRLYGIVMSEDLNDSKLVQIDTVTGELYDTADWIVPYPLDLCWDNHYLWNVSGAQEFFDIQIGGKMRIYKVQTNLAPTSIEKSTTSDGLKVYPNPFKSYLTIVNVDITIKDLHLMDIRGKVLKTIYSGNSKENLDLSFLNTGLYFLKQNDKIIKIVKVE